MEHNQACNPASFSSRDPACDHCRSKKIRCDRMLPRCGNCRRACVTCSYRSNPWIEGHKSEKSTRARNALVGRLSLLENSLESLADVVNHNLLGEVKDTTSSLPSVLSGLGGMTNIERDRRKPVFKLQDGQRFLYGLYSHIAQCEQTLKALVKMRESQTRKSPIFDQHVEQVSMICSLMFSELFQIGTDYRPLDQPPQLAVTKAIEEFFTQKTCLRYLFHPSVLRSHIRLYYLGAFGPSEEAMRLCLKYILLVTGSPEEVSSNSKPEQLSLKHFLASARVALKKGHLQTNKVVNVQALASVSLIAFASEDLLLADEAFHQCCSMTKRIGLHQEMFSSDEPFELFEERQLLFWTLYVLDKSICFVLGRPCLLPSFDCSTQYPDVGFNSVVVDLLLADIGLAAIQERIYKTLLGSNIANGSLGRGEEIRSLIGELESWKNNFIRSTKDSASPDPISCRIRLYHYHTTLAIVLAESTAPDVKDHVVLNARYALNQVCAQEHYTFSKEVNWAVGLHSLIPFFIVVRHVLAEPDSERQLADLQLLRSAIDIWECGQGKGTSTLLIGQTIMAVEAIHPTKTWDAALQFEDENPFQNMFSQMQGQSSTSSNVLINDVSLDNPLIDSNLLGTIQGINGGDIQTVGSEQGNIDYPMFPNFPVLDILDGAQSFMQVNNFPTGYTWK